MMLLVAATAIVAAYRASSMQQTVSPPPPSLAGLGKRPAHFVTTYPGLEGLARYDMLLNRIEVTWIRDFGDGARRLSSQVEPVTFWPTEVAAFGPNRLCIGGKTIKGQTIIRLWEFSAAETLEDHQVDPVSGVTTYPETFIPVASTTTLYSGNTSGRRLVRMMLKNHGETEKVFVQFEDGRDLLELEVTTGQFTPVVTTTLEPKLLRSYADRFARDHEDLGYLYFLHSDVNPDGLSENLIFVDADRDGSLEAFSTIHLLGGLQWKQQFEEQTKLHEVF